MRWCLLLLLVALAVSDPNYSQELSKVTASYCAISHCPQQSIEKWTCKLCAKAEPLTNIHYIDNKEFSNVGIIGYSAAREAIIVAWRGTVDVENIIEDLSLEMTDYFKCKGCKIHIGFHFAFIAIQKQLTQQVNELLVKYPNAKIIVAGHSLGGAMATIAALELQLKYNKVTALYAFGCPRIGNENYAHFVDLKINDRFRVVHNRDLVPHLPPETFGFYHIAQEIFYNQNFSEFKKCSLSGEDKTCSNKFAPDYTPSDHDLYFYMMDTSVC